jgi:pyruvate ferredoxin oxidoreductase alpha subunit
MLMPDQEEVDRFLPPHTYPSPLDPSRPLSMGVVGPQYIYPEAKKFQVEVLEGSRPVIGEVWDDFARIFGRRYRPVEIYPETREKPGVMLLTMGSYSETAMDAIDNMRQAGKDVGLIKLRLWRPFPFTELRRAVEGVHTLVVFDRAISFGGPGGPVSSEVRSALYGEKSRPKIVNIVGGLGGRDVTVANFVSIVEKGMEMAGREHGPEFEMFGVRE